MKRIVSVVPVLALVLCLSACGEAPQESPTTTGAARRHLASLHRDRDSQSAEAVKARKAVEKGKWSLPKTPLIKAVKR